MFCLFCFSAVLNRLMWKSSGKRRKCAVELSQNIWLIFLPLHLQWKVLIIDSSLQTPHQERWKQSCACPLWSLGSTSPVFTRMGQVTKVSWWHRRTGNLENLVNFGPCRGFADKGWQDTKNGMIFQSWQQPEYMDCICFRHQSPVQEDDNTFSPEFLSESQLQHDLWSVLGLFWFQNWLCFHTSSSCWCAHVMWQVFSFLFTGKKNKF